MNTRVMENQKWLLRFVAIRLPRKKGGRPDIDKILLDAQTRAPDDNITKHDIENTIKEIYRKRNQTAPTKTRQPKAKSIQVSRLQKCTIKRIGQHKIRIIVPGELDYTTDNIGTLEINDLGLIIFTV